MQNLGLKDQNKPWDNKTNYKSTNDEYIPDHVFKTIKKTSAWIEKVNVPLVQLQKKNHKKN